MENSILGIIFALISTASWALCTIILKKLGERLEPIGITTVKSCLSTLFLFIAILLTTKEIFVTKEYLFPIALSGLIGIAIGYSFFFASLNRLSPMVLSLILFVGPDLFTGIFGLLFLGEMPTVIAWIGIILTLIGLSLFIFPIKTVNTTNDKSTTTIIGIILAILSLCCTAYSMVIIKPVLQMVPTITATMYRMLFSAVGLIIIGLYTKKIFNWKYTLSDKKYSLKLTSTMLLSTFGGFWLSLSAIKYCDLIIASTIMTLEPLFILLFMIVFNGYKPKRKEYLGIIFIIMGIIFICKG